MDISTTIAEILQTEPDRPVMEWRGQWWTQGQLARFFAELEAILSNRNISKDMAIALAGRNRPSHAFAQISLLAAARPISMLYAFQSAESFARDLDGTPFAALIMDEQDWAEPVKAAAGASGTVAILLPALPDQSLRVIDPPAQISPEAAYRLPEMGVEILSSGTTGLPKRIFHPSSRLFRSLAGGLATPGGKPEIVMWPLSGIGGNISLAAALVRHVPFILLEKFTPEDVVDAVRRHELVWLPFTPTMVRMFYDANIPPEHLKSINVFMGGSGPLDPDLQDKFEERYGKPLIWAMGATEFCGTVIAWSVDLHREFRQSKRGSAGKALPGCKLRITDPETGAEVPTDQIGRLEVQTDAVGPDWIVTNDLARIDADGFVFFAGRSDGAINRGGFKIVPEKLCEILRLHPKVAEAAVVGVHDERLGEVPVAVVEPQPGQSVDADELEAHMRDHLPAPSIPVRFFVVDSLPYTASTKVAIAQVRAIVSEKMSMATA